MAFFDRLALYRFWRRKDVQANAGFNDGTANGATDSFTAGGALRFRGQAEHRIYHGR
jgi:hypothetical protein